MIYFPGCTARLKLKNISQATQAILDHAEFNYRVLEDENCCGSVLLRTGFREDAREVMERAFKKLKGQKLVVSCAGCYRTFKEDYLEVLGEQLDVVHINQILDELILDEKIQIEREDLLVTYHDPCHLGRHLGEYDAPRNIIKKRATLVEMDKNREEARCCGAGGGVKSAYPDLSQDMSLRRVNDALKTGADVLVTSCPFCVWNLESDKLKVMDLTEFIRRGIILG
ncbi:MAG: hypothetical protein BME94_00665 [Methanobacteriales archaeon Met13]